jgi:RNA polymerase sigma-70 factor, ECF subfamily
MASWRSGLLEAFRDGDRGALEEVYCMYVGTVRRLVATLLWRHRAVDGVRAARGGQPDLPDVVQEVFICAFAPSARRRFDGLRDYQPFLRRIARDVTVDHVRRDRPHLPLDDEASARIAAEQPLDLAQLRVLAVLESSVASLPPELRHVHDAIYVDGLSQREAAAALGLGRQTVRTRDARLRHVLRLELGPARGSPA